MTISSSLNAGVAGLNANAARLATIADNIANSGTYGYKRAGADFESMVISQNAGAGVYSAGGVRAQTIRLIDERGAIVSTANSMDIAVSGRGMLPVIAETSVDNRAGNDALMMTRTGSFHTDTDGMLKTETGLVLMGWAADADGTIPAKPRDTIVGLEPVVVRANQTAADPTTRITLGVTLPTDDTAFDSTGEPLPVPVEYFGNLGTSETLGVTFTPTLPAADTDPRTNTWTMVVTDSASGDAVIGTYTLVFDESRTNGGSLASVTPDGTSPGYDATNGTITLNVAGGPIEITIGRLGDANGVTQLVDFQTSVTKDGSPVGSLTAIEIDEGGLIHATYDTGFTRVIYQVPMVDVPNYNGLTAQNDQTFEVSPDSGSFYLWDAGDGPTGDVVGYAREGSTTDVANELTSLIQTQRAYSSNAKIIQTVDEMLQETTNIKR